ncbi:MAG: hypothetical protein R3C03_22560 [Pirellulaceae bacterium]
MNVWPNTVNIVMQLLDAGAVTEYPVDWMPRSCMERILDDAGTDRSCHSQATGR